MFLFFFVRLCIYLWLLWLLLLLLLVMPVAVTAEAATAATVATTSVTVSAVTYDCRNGCRRYLCTVWNTSTAFDFKFWLRFLFFILFLSYTRLSFDFTQTAIFWIMFLSVWKFVNFILIYVFSDRLIDSVIYEAKTHTHTHTWVRLWIFLPKIGMKIINWAEKFIWWSTDAIKDENGEYLSWDPIFA